MKKFIGPGSR